MPSTHYLVRAHRYLQIPAVMIVAATATAGLAEQTFFDFCMNPGSDEIRATVEVMSYRAGYGLSSGRKDRCQGASEALPGLQHLKLHREPFDPWWELTTLEPVQTMPWLTTLSASHNKIRDVTPVADLTNLRTLIVYDNLIENLEPVRNLKRLSWLIAQKNRISSLDPLAGLRTLDSLNVAENQISTLEPLRGLTAMDSLYLGDNLITSLEPISGMTRLTHLSAGNNKIGTLRHVYKMKKMVRLFVGGNALRDLEGLHADMTNFDALDLSRNLISDIAPLNALTSMRWLDLRHNQIQDYKALSSMENLEYLYIEGNPSTELPPEILILQEEHLNTAGKPIRLKVDIAQNGPEQHP